MVTGQKGTTAVFTPEVLAEAAAVGERWWALSLLVSAWQEDRRVQVQLRLLVSRP